MARRVLLVVGTIGLVGLSACAVVATRQAAQGGAQTLAAPVAAPANGSTSSARAPVGDALADPSTAGQGRAPGVHQSGATNAAPSTSRPPAASGGGAGTAAGNVSGGQCTSVPFFHCYTK